jgi:hypothetical protein
VNRNYFALRNIKINVFSKDEIIIRDPWNNVKRSNICKYNSTRKGDLYLSCNRREKNLGETINDITQINEKKRLILGVKSYMDKKDINVKEIC